MGVLPEYRNYGIGRLLKLKQREEALAQGVLAGALPIYLFAHAVMALGAGRAATFPALVPVFGVILGYLTLGVVPSPAQFAGLAIVLIGFQFTLRR